MSTNLECSGGLPSTPPSAPPGDRRDGRATESAWKALGLDTHRQGDHKAGESVGNKLKRQRERECTPDNSGRVLEQHLDDDAVAITPVRANVNKRPRKLRAPGTYALASTASPQSPLSPSSSPSVVTRSRARLLASLADSVRSPCVSDSHNSPSRPRRSTGASSPVANVVITMARGRKQDNSTPSPSGNLRRRRLRYNSPSPHRLVLKTPTPSRSTTPELGGMPSPSHDSFVTPPRQIIAASEKRSAPKAPKQKTRKVDLLGAKEKGSPGLPPLGEGLGKGRLLWPEAHEAVASSGKKPLAKREGL